MVIQSSANDVSNYTSTYRFDYESRKQTSTELPPVRPSSPILTARPFRLHRKPNLIEVTEIYNPWESQYQYSYKRSKPKAYDGKTHVDDVNYKGFLVNSNHKNAKDAWSSTYTESYNVDPNSNKSSKIANVSNFCPLYVYLSPDQTEQYRRHMEKRMDELALTYRSPNRNRIDDADFPYENSHPNSLLKFNIKELEWNRPKELSYNPVLFNKNDSVLNDIRQGFLADCWFLSSCAAIYASGLLFDNSFKFVQSSLTDKSYKGILTFRFWVFGKWMEITIDDKLPIYSKDLIFAQCNDPDEFWISLIEKAYAKLYDGYEHIEYGNPCDSFTDLTGGIAEIFSTDNSLIVEDVLLEATESRALITCSRRALDSLGEPKSSGDLISNHGYQVIGAYVVPWDKGGNDVIVHIRSPWGNNKEWNGPWSDRDNRWDKFSTDFKKFIGYLQKSDGEYFMNIQDFSRCFHQFVVCQINSLSAETFGTWEHDANSQILMELETLPTSKVVTVVIALMQPDKRKFKENNYRMGFKLYRLDSFTQLPVNTQTLVSLPEICFQFSEKNREIVYRLKLNSGNYLFLPLFTKSAKSSEFLLRIFTRGFIKLKSYFNK